MQIGAATVENNVEFLQKPENRTAFLPSDSTSGIIYPKNPNLNCTNSKEYMHPYVHSSATYNRQYLETA